MRGDAGKAVPGSAWRVIANGLHQGRADGIVHEMAQRRFHMGNEAAKIHRHSLWGDLLIRSSLGLFRAKRAFAPVASKGRPIGQDQPWCQIVVDWQGIIARDKVHLLVWFFAEKRQKLVFSRAGY